MLYSADVFGKVVVSEDINKLVAYIDEQNKIQRHYDCPMGIYLRDNEKRVIDPREGDCRYIHYTTNTTSFSLCIRRNAIMLGGE